MQPRDHAGFSTTTLMMMMVMRMTVMAAGPDDRDRADGNEP